MALAPLPEEILDRFRTSSRNRLAQVKAAWTAFTQGSGTDEMAREMHRNVHTLKGDSRMVQFHDIHLVCQNLEDLLTAADARQHQVSADFDLVVNMALDFIGLLLRRRGDQEVDGIDIQGFVKQVRKVIRREARYGKSDPQTPVGGLGVAGVSNGDRISDSRRKHLAVAATKVFLEYLSASGSARTRLRSAWTDLQQQIEAFGSETVSPLLERHAKAAAEVGAELGLQLSVELDVGDELRVSAESLEALDVALMHGLRNALSHGIEPPAERRAAGKSEGGTLQLSCCIVQGRAQVCIRDDGRGIDVERVRARAVKTGAMHPDVASNADREALLELLFQPRFSTQAHADTIAGRGIGLDALRTALSKAGGSVSITGAPGQGATLRIELPLVRRDIDIHAFDAYGGRMVLGVSAEWQASWHELEAGADPLDPIACLQIRRPEDDTGLLISGVPEVLRVEGLGIAVEMVATKPSRILVAERICPTPESFPVEIVSVEGIEVLLLRPDKLPTPVPESNEW